jgi:hypothetical protein
MLLECRPSEATSLAFAAVPTIAEIRKPWAVCGIEQMHRWHASLGATLLLQIQTWLWHKPNVCSCYGSSESEGHAIAPCVAAQAYGAYQMHRRIQAFVRALT